MNSMRQHHARTSTQKTDLDAERVDGGQAKAFPNARLGPLLFVSTAKQRPMYLWGTMPK